MEAEHKENQHYTLRPPQPVGIPPPFKGLKVTTIKKRGSHTSHNNLRVNKKLQHSQGKTYGSKNQKTKITYKSKTIVVQPWKLVATVPNKVQKPTKQKLTHNHRPTAKANTANAPRNQKAI